MSENGESSTPSTMSDSLIMARNLEALSDVLQKMTTSDVVTDDELRIALKHRASDIVTLSRQNRIEGRPLDYLRWVTSFPEFLLENPVQEEIRLSRLGRKLFDDFVTILDAENRSIVEYKEVLRAIGTIPGIGDIAWQELHQSPLKGLVAAIKNEEAIARLLALVLKVGTLLYNRSILDAVNSRAEEVVEAFEGRRNPDLVRNILGALILLPSSPWKVKNPDAPKRGKLNSDIVDAVLLRTIKYVPEVEEITKLAAENHIKLRTVIERTIERLGWPFVRSYLSHIAGLGGEQSSYLRSISDSMQPLGRVNLTVLFKLISQENPVPRQIIQSALGAPDEYILSYDGLERDGFVKGFKSDGIELETSIDALHIQGHHLENARTGIRLTEAIVGKSSLIRLLVDMKTDQSEEIAVSFVKGLLLSPYHPISVKRAAREWMKLLEKE